VRCILKSFADFGDSIDEDRNLVEMTLRKTPSRRSAPTNPKIPLGDFVEGQKVDAAITKVRKPQPSSLSIGVLTKQLMQVETYGMFLRIEETDISGLCHRSEVR